MKKHKQHLIDHNTLESTAQKVDSTQNAQNLNNSQAETPTPTTQPPQDSNPTPSTQDSTTQLTKAVTPTLTPSQQESWIFALESRALQGERGDKAGSPIAQASRSNPRF